jgi:Na+/glutamate symporter
MELWKRSLITFLAVLVVGFAISLVWRAKIGTDLPDYLAALVGGLVAILVWEGLKRVGRKT